MSHLYSYNRSAEMNKFANWRTKVISHTPEEMKVITCRICDQIAIQPIQVTINQEWHRFCLDCVEKWKKVFDTLPWHNLSLDKWALVPTYVDQSRAKQIILRCDYRDNGCKKSLTRAQYESHVNYCQFRVCDICNQRYDESKDHSQCQNRMLGYTTANSKLQKDFKEVQNKLKTITDSHKSLTEELTAIKKVIAIPTEDKTEKDATNEIGKQIDTLRQICEVDVYSEVSTRLDKQLKAFSTEEKIGLNKNKALKVEDKSKTVTNSELSKKFEQLVILIEGIRSDLNNQD